MSLRWPDAEDLLTLIGESTGPQTRVDDTGTFVAVAIRPHVTLLGEAAYPTAIEQAAALMHAIMVWRPLTHWNSGFAWTAVRTFFERYDLRLVMPADERMRLTDEITSGSLHDVKGIASRLGRFIGPAEAN